MSTGGQTPGGGGDYLGLMRALVANPAAFTGGTGTSPFARTLAANPQLPSVSPQAASLAAWQPPAPIPQVAPVNPIPALMAQQQTAQQPSATQPVDMTPMRDALQSGVGG